MLGKYVRIKVTHPIHSYSNEQGFTYELNYGEVEGAKQFNASVKGAFIMGINHPVRSFDGRVVGIVRYDGSNETDWVVAPKSTRFINIDIANGIDFAVDIYPFYSSDVTVAWRSGHDIPAGLIGPGVHASHGMERTHRDGMMNTVRLLAAYLGL